MTTAGAPPVVGSLSPSRAGDFLSCPLLFRYRTIDRLPEGSSPEAVRGTLVHQVLEEIFDLPAAERTRATARAMVAPAWARLRARSEEAREIAAALVGEEAWLSSAGEAVQRWFDLEDPTRLEPAEREVFVETVLDSGLKVRGIIDRLDEAPDGALRVVDYKSGRSPGAGHETRALFQLRIYGLVLWRSRGRVPSLLRLVYLGDSQVISYEPDETSLLATERKLGAIWAAVTEARASGVFEPSRGKQCDWCSFKAHCPEFGGTLLPMPARATSGPGAGPDAAVGRGLPWLRARWGGVRRLLSRARRPRSSDRPR